MQNVIFLLKMDAISRYFEELGQYFALHTQTTYVAAKCHWDVCNNEGARAGEKIRAHILDPPPASAAAASTLSRTYRFYTSCGT